MQLIGQPEGVETRFVGPVDLLFRPHVDHEGDDEKQEHGQREPEMEKEARGGRGLQAHD